MPANLPPMYFEAEKRYREARTPEGKVEALEEMMAIMPKHKGTDKLAVNKVDTAADEEDYRVFLELAETNLPTLDVSVRKGRNLHALVGKIYTLSNLIRVYTRAPGKEPDLSAPLS